MVVGSSLELRHHGKEKIIRRFTVPHEPHLQLIVNEQCLRDFDDTILAAANQWLSNLNKR